MKKIHKTLPKIVAVVGPTASGKSDLAVLLALKFNGEVISADSRQVYRGMDIGTGKITKKEMQKVPHHLLDLASPKRTYSVAQYKREAERTISQILKRSKVPIICGGTGFYIQAIVDGLVLPEVKADQSLRKKLGKMSTTELYEMLRKKDPKRAKTIDSKNKVRLVRALEIISSIGKVPAVRKIEKYDPLFIGLEVPQITLRKRIALRLTKRMKQGMVNEALRLKKGGVSFKRMEALGLEYRYLANYLEKKTDKATMLRELETAIAQYAKRQYTWFRRDGRIHWINFSNRERALTLVQDFLNK